MKNLKSVGGLGAGPNYLKSIAGGSRSNLWKNRQGISISAHCKLYLDKMKTV